MNYEDTPKPNSLDSVEGLDNKREIINSETLKVIDEVYSAAERTITAGRIPFKERVEIIRKSTDLRTLVPKIGCKEYFDGLGVINEKILGIEKEMGIPIDFFDSNSLRLFLDFYKKMQDENIRSFLEEIKSRPSIDTPGFLWSNELFKRGGGLACNYPSRIVDFFAFSSRLLVRICINQIKEKDLYSPDIERIILNTIPPYRIGNAERDIDSDYFTDGKKTLAEIIEVSEKAKLEFYNLPNIESISEIIKETLMKLRVVDGFRHKGNRTLDDEAETVVSKDIREIILEKQEEEPFTTLFSHEFSYVLNNLGILSDKPKN